MKCRMSHSPNWLKTLIFLNANLHYYMKFLKQPDIRTQKVDVTQKVGWYSVFYFRYGENKFVLILPTIYFIFKIIIILTYSCVLCSCSSSYNFLRKQNLLPLPCVKSIPTHLLAVKHECGFDNGFFKLLKKKFEEKSEYQKKGVLL